MTFPITRKIEARRFLTTLLLVSVAVLAIGLAGSFVLLRKVESQLLTNQQRAAEQEAAVMARFIDRDLSDQADPTEILNRLQAVLHGSGSRTEFLCLLDAEGRVISHPDPAMIGMPRGAVELTRTDTRENVSIASVLRSRQPGAGLLSEPNMPLQIAHYQPVQGKQWTVAVHKNAAAIAGEFAAVRWKLLGAAVPTLMLISLVGAGMARSLGRRFEQELEIKNASLETRVNERTAELRRALAELQLAHERLMQGEKMHLLGELMAGIAHEINNPLAVISGHAELLSRDPGRDSTRAGAVIAQQTQRVIRIVRNLLDFAHNRPAERAPGSLSDVLHDAEELIAAELGQAQIRLDTSIAADIPPVLMDSQQMEQVFINLVRNAGHALAKQPGERLISVRAFTDGLWVAVQVRDNGPGIPTHMRERIFDAFVTTKSDGTGLGLSLCKRFVESHGGRIELLATPPGTGACFQFRLPAFAPQAPTPLPAIETSAHT